jgi:CelD/BcsL family acetyltransferase involved in cellulose biosynthesis
MRRLRIARSVAEIADLGPLWQELEHDAKATIFQSYRWNLAAARHLGRRQAPCVVALERESGAAIVPAALVDGGTAAFLGELLFDYRDLLAAGDGAVAEEALAALGKYARELSLPAVREDARIARCNAMLDPWVGAPIVRRARLSPEDFLRDHFRARKQMRRLRSAGASFGRYHGDTQPLLRRLYEKKGEQFAGAPLDIFSDPARRDCMLEIAGASGRSCDVFTIEAGSALVAGLVTFRERGVRRLYTIWHDPAWQHFSPGIVLLLHAVHTSLEEGLDADFLTGEQPHKTRFATDRVQLYRLHASAEQLRRREAVRLAA